MPVSMIMFLLNLLWLLFGGLWMSLAWVLAGICLAVTIVGLPWARAAFTIAAYTFLPFGYRITDRRNVTGREDIGTGSFGTLGNILWFLFAGLWIAIGHMVVAISLALTIIGLPFAWVHLKLAGLALWPIGRTIVPVDGPSPGT